MNDKKDNSISEDKLHSEDLELFDTIFTPIKSAESPHSKKEFPDLDKTSDKTVKQKVPKKVKQSVGFPKKASTKKKIPLTDEKPIKKEIKTTKIPDKNKIRLITLTVALMIIVLVVLSIFSGKFIDYNPIMDLFKTTGPLTSSNETAPYDDTNRITVNITRESKDIPTEEDVADQEIEQSMNEVQEEIKGIIDISENEQQLHVEQNIDRVSEVSKEEILSYQYSVYLGSFRTITKVKEASDRYFEMGLSPYWVKLDLEDKGIWFRLFAGYFQTREEADEFIKKRKIKGAESRRIRYANLIGFYTSKEEIERQKAILEKLGYSPYIISDTEKNFRLFLGAFYQRIRAERQNTHLANNGIPSQLVER
jgi:hypothetical protein